MVGAATKPAPQQPPPKSRPTSSQRESGSSSRRGGGRPAAWVRVLVSLVLVWHLTAVALAPMSLPPSSEFVVDIAQQPPMQWYLDLLYLNHGYHFFAPDPGDGRLIRFAVFDERGGLIEQGEFPNTKEYWPRLYYHRYFMLADQVGIPSSDEEYSKQWQRRYLEAYARQLLREHEGQSVRVQWIVHYQLPPDLAKQEVKITDPKSYQLLMEVTQRRSDLASPAGDQSGAWQQDPWRSGRVDSANRWIGGRR